MDQGYELWVYSVWGMSRNEKIGERKEVVVDFIKVMLMIGGEESMISSSFTLLASP